MLVLKNADVFDGLSKRYSVERLQFVAADIPAGYDCAYKSILPAGT